MPQTSPPVPFSFPPPLPPHLTPLLPLPIMNLTEVTPAVRATGSEDEQQKVLPLARSLADILEMAQTCPLAPLIIMNPTPSSGSSQQHDRDIPEVQGGGQSRMLWPQGSRRGLKYLIPRLRSLPWSRNNSRRQQQQQEGDSILTEAEDACSTYCCSDVQLLGGGQFLEALLPVGGRIASLLRWTGDQILGTTYSTSQQ